MKNSTTLTTNGRSIFEQLADVPEAQWETYLNLSVRTGKITDEEAEIIKECLSKKQYIQKDVHIERLFVFLIKNIFVHILDTFSIFFYIYLIYDTILRYKYSKRRKPSSTVYQFMNLEDLELPKVKMSPVASEVTENNLVEDELEINGEVHSNFMNNGWKKILALNFLKLTIQN